MGIKIKSLNLEALVAAEKAANAVRKNYEDKIVMYRGFNAASLEENEKKDKELAETSQKLGRINAVRLKVLDEMQKKLLDLDCND
jgi:hypothetical protein